MSGKAYTMKEMKSIVEYLTEHRAYAEIKGRKMWMDFANSKLTNRTWQSLKETFLKRILPDIHNPYYKLTMDQIRSFKDGYDVIAREKNKLEIFEIEDDSNTNAEKETEKATTSHANNGEATSGEDIKCEKIESHDRASVETVIIANCYETEDDLRRVLESGSSPRSDNNEKNPDSAPTKSLRDLITYSEPLTPMMQEVLNDFATDDESDGELRMQIVENDEESSPVIASKEPTIEINDERSSPVIANEEPAIEVFDSDDVAEKNEENISKKDKFSEGNIKQAKTLKEIEKHNKSTENNILKTAIGAENNANINETILNSSGNDKCGKDNQNKNKELSKNKSEKHLENNKTSKVMETEKVADSILSNNVEQTIAESKISDKTAEKDKITVDSIGKASEKISENEYEIIDHEDFVQPKVISLKLRKRKALDKIKSLSKHVNRAEMYEIVESEILEKSSSNVPEVDKMSNYANNNEEIVSSTVSDKPTQNSSNSDTILPNNQEALNNSDKRTSTESQNDISKIPRVTETVVKAKTTRKRAISQDVPSSSNAKKNKLKLTTNRKEKAVSDTDDVVMKKLIKAKLAKSKLDLQKKKIIGEDKKEKEKGIETRSKIDGTNIANEVIPEDEPLPSQPILDSSQASELNPCLRSVSLFAEQFNTVRYDDSESEKGTTPAVSATDNNKDNKPSASNRNEEKSNLGESSKKKADESTNSGNNKTKRLKEVRTLAMNVDEVVMLKSHSDSESETDKVTPSRDKLPASQKEIEKAQRDQVLASVFGFNSGSLKRKKRLSYRKNTSYYQRRDESSFDSSEWTSESDSEAYVSPPRGRKNKQTRKYLKPHASRILSLEDEGGLFVMYGKKIYPLVKDGQIIKNYLTYLPESDPEEEESYWKLKYVEERKRVAELKKLMKENQEREEIVRDKSPILPARPLRLSTSHRQEPPAVNMPIKDSSKELVVPEKENKEVENNTGKTLKITFAKNNQEVHVEGHWSNIHPVLAEVVQLFNQDNEAANGKAKNLAANGPGKVAAIKRPSVAISEQSVAVLPSPVDEDLLEKVNKLETEIFKEIEVRDQEEATEETNEKPETNVTKRKRASRVRKSTSSHRSSEPYSSPSSTRSPKRLKTSTDGPKDEDQEQTPRKPSKKISETEQKNVKQTKVAKETLDAVDSTTNVASARKTRTPKKIEKEAQNKSTSTTEVKTRPTRSKPAQETKGNTSQVEEDSEIRYMFPPTTRGRKSTLNLSKSKDKSKRTANPPKTLSPPHFSMQDESTQGYQDSDVSPPKLNLRRKRKLSLSTVLYRNKNKSSRPKRRSFPCISDEGSNDSSSAFQIILRPRNSSLNSEVYRSDSYQSLFPKNKVLKPLDKIDEDSPITNDQLHPNKSVDGRILKISLNDINKDFLTSSNGNTECNSSNVSLPLSPELSIVEKLSISKELVNSVENHPTLNEMQANNSTANVIHNKYLISQVDVSMPLMQQECGLHESIKNEFSLDSTKRSAVSDSLLNKIDTVNIADAPSLSESLDARLRDLLLESAKKMSISSVQMEVQNEKSDNNNEVQKKGKSKRCSTPRKKKDVKKRKLPAVDPVVEEEFTESCSYGGRQSCPPVIQVIDAEGTHDENVIIDKDTVTTRSKGRKKKDVIKVKILRPSKSRSRSPDPKVTKNTSKTTVHTDSGINESGLTAQGWNDSVDLIHNHSETCLLANECMGDSVEFIETNTNSIISLNTDSATSPDRISGKELVFQDCRDFVPDHSCENAQSFCNIDYVPESEKLIPDNISDTVYHSPVVSEASINSLITEDLSDETPQSSQPSKWYLLSEDDTNTNVPSRSASNSIPSSFGSNLKQIFPITCAVPDLSTITEMSNENGKKETASANSTRHDLDSQSMFDNMNSN